MAPEHLTVTKDMLSPYAEKLLDAQRPRVPTEKLDTQSNGQDKVCDTLPQSPILS